MTGGYIDGVGFRSAVSLQNARLAAPGAKSLCARLLAVMDEKPSTADEAGAAIGVNFQSARARTADNHRNGLITDSGARRKGALGGIATVWRVTTEAEREALAEERARRAAEAVAGVPPLVESRDGSSHLSVETLQDLHAAAVQGRAWIGSTGEARRSSIPALADVVRAALLGRGAPPGPAAAHSEPTPANPHQPTLFDVPEGART
jgi:hypothetical protein